MTRKPLSFLLTLSLVLSLLSGCGGGPASPSPAPASTKDAATSAAQPVFALRSGGDGGRERGDGRISGAVIWKSCPRRVSRPSASY
jgi:hypothetical protein